ncbi:MAG: BrnT family toxin [Candidatus Rokubacteria bacterium]|nr:BrnT family toxin [Candidatus Rokubacteria bacterium]
MPRRFDSDPEKAKRNIAEHGVSFDEAAEVFDDPLSYTVEDREHSSPDEVRFKTIGYSRQGKLLVVIHTETNDRPRLISARPPTTHERQMYEEGL